MLTYRYEPLGPVRQMDVAAPPIAYTPPVHTSTNTKLIVNH